MFRAMLRTPGSSPCWEAPFGYKYLTHGWDFVAEPEVAISAYPPRLLRGNLKPCPKMGSHLGGHCCRNLEAGTEEGRKEPECLVLEVCSETSCPKGKPARSEGKRDLYGFKTEGGKAVYSPIWTVVSEVAFIPFWAYGVLWGGTRGPAAFFHFSNEIQHKVTAQEVMPHLACEHGHRPATGDPFQAPESSRERHRVMESKGKRPRKGGQDQKEGVKQRVRGKGSIISLPQWPDSCGRFTQM